MARDDENEDSVLFSLSELKRVNSEQGGRARGAADQASATREAAAAQREPARSMKAHDPDEDGAAALLSASLSTLRQRVDDDRRRAEVARLGAEEEKRLIAESEQLEAALQREVHQQERLSTERQAGAERVAKLRAESKRIEEADLERAGVVAASVLPRGLVVKPAVLALLVLLFLGGLGGMAAYTFTRPPMVKVVTKEGVAVQTAGQAGVPALAQDFGQEIGWLAVNDVAAPPPVAAAEPEEEDKPKRRRGGGRRKKAESSSAPSTEPAGKKRVLLPPKPTGGGFVY